MKNMNNANNYIELFIKSLNLKYMFKFTKNKYNIMCDLSGTGKSYLYKYC